MGMIPYMVLLRDAVKRDQMETQPLGIRTGQVPWVGK